MSILKGFAQIASLIDNNPHSTSPVGEISADSKTFVRDYLTYNHSNWPGMLMLVMQSLDDDLIKTQPTSIQTQASLEVINWVYGQAITGAIGPAKNSFVQLFEGEFTNRFTLLNSGEHIQANGNWYPSSVSIAPIGRESDDNWTIWFADSAFSNEFDLSLLYVIPPIENLDQFFNTAPTVKALVEAVTRTEIMDHVNVVRDEDPYTILRMDAFDWVDPNDVNVKVNTYWNVIIYGRAGDNLDRVKQAIIDYVLTHSSYPVEDWAEIFPDIFRSTELILAPSFFVRGVPDQQFERGVYSAISSFQDSLALMKLVAKGTSYNDTHITNNLTNIPSLFRSTSISLVPGPENRIGYQNFRDIYWDYINVPTTHVDFVRMRETTRSFVMLLTDMLEKAEALTPSTVVPAGYNRVERDGIWYLTKSNQDLLILVVSKYSIKQISATLNLPTDKED